MFAAAFSLDCSLGPPLLLLQDSEVVLACFTTSWSQRDVVAGVDMFSYERLTVKYGRMMAE